MGHVAAEVCDVNAMTGISDLTCGITLRISAVFPENVRNSSVSF